MSKISVYKAVIVGLLLIILGLSFVSVRQYQALTREKIMNLTIAYEYMKDIIEDGLDNNFKDWDEDAAELFILVERTRNGKESWGDYIEISNLISQVASIENPKEQNNYLKEVAEKRVSWSTEKWNWGATWIE